MSQNCALGLSHTIAEMGLTEDSKVGKARVGEVLQGQIQVNEYLDRHVLKDVSVQCALCLLKICYLIFGNWCLEYLDRHVFKAVSVQVLAQDLLSDGKVHKKNSALLSGRPDNPKHILASIILFF